MINFTALQKEQLLAFEKVKTLSYNHNIINQDARLLALLELGYTEFYRETSAQLTEIIMVR